MAGMEGGAECQEIGRRGCAVWCRGVHGAVHNRNAMEEGTEKELSWNAMGGGHKTELPWMGVELAWNRNAI